MASNYRMAELLVQLITGQTLDQKNIQKKYGIDIRTAQRDISYIRSALAEYDAGEIVSKKRNVPAIT
ncbi:hypothetical protein [Paucilactobacillus hokkaidonensis]|uniref:hypothetical protein n=1 Tax=Paucilactobacillus hokkaidonensis TaxID=1193095 RepID=UPI0006D16316|nr:hypothetical protein [Paucilactobacillus hokkaidonensis]